MARRRRQIGDLRRWSPYAGSVRQNPVRRPPPRRRTLFSRAGRKGAVLTMTATAIVAIGGVAIAGAIGSSGGSAPTAAGSPSLPPVSPPSVTPSQPVGVLAPTPAATHSSPRAHIQAPQPSVTPSHPVKSATHAATPAATRSATTSSCPLPAGRVQAARRLMQHPGALPSVRVVTASGRQGLLGASDPIARTLTLYVRSCAEEPTVQLAFVWGYEAGQFIPTETWGSSRQARWAQLRGISGTPSSTVLKQDAASVYAFWQTGTTRYWQSPIAPPSSQLLSSLVPFLHTA
jgi:hypothetical protein